MDGKVTCVPSVGHLGLQQNGRIVSKRNETSKSKRAPVILYNGVHLTNKIFGTSDPLKLKAGEMEEIFPEEMIDAMKDAFTYIASQGREDEAEVSYNKALIGKKEIGFLLRSFGEEATEEELKYLIAKQDMDHNGVLDFGEFLNKMADQSNREFEVEDVETEKLFYMIDRDNDGEIGIEDLMEYMEHIEEPVNEEECEAMLMFHKKKRGEPIISYEDFTYLLNMASS